MWSNGSSQTLLQKGVNYKIVLFKAKHMNILQPLLGMHTTETLPYSGKHKIFTEVLSIKPKLEATKTIISNRTNNKLWCTHIIEYKAMKINELQVHMIQKKFRNMVRCGRRQTDKNILNDPSSYIKF